MFCVPILATLGVRSALRVVKLGVIAAGASFVAWRLASKAEKSLRVFYD